MDVGAVGDGAAATAAIFCRSYRCRFCRYCRCCGCCGCCVCCFCQRVCLTALLLLLGPAVVAGVITCDCEQSPLRESVAGETSRMQSAQCGSRARCPPVSPCGTPQGTFEVVSLVCTSVVAPWPAENCSWNVRQIARNQHLLGDGRSAGSAISPLAARGRKDAKRLPSAPIGRKRLAAKGRRQGRASQVLVALMPVDDFLCSTPQLDVYPTPFVALFETTVTNILICVAPLPQLGLC